MRRRTLWCLLLVGLTPTLAIAADPDAQAMTQAKALAQKGKYAEAVEAYDAIVKDLKDDAPERPRAVLGRAEALVAIGEYDKAEEGLSTLTKGDAPDADAVARLADLDFRRGRWDKADERVKLALKAQPDHVAARWVQALLLEAKGQKKEADAAFKWFIDHFNNDKAKLSRDAEALLIIGQAAERYYRANARGEDLKETLEEVMNDLYEGALKADPRCWRSPLLQGRLFLSGYNETRGDEGARRGHRRSTPPRPSSSSPWARRICRVTSSRLGPQEGGGGAGGEPALRAGACAAGRPEHLRRAVRRRSGIGQEGRGREPEATRTRWADWRPRYRLLVDPAGTSAVEAVAEANSPRPAEFLGRAGREAGGSPQVSLGREGVPQGDRRRPGTRRHPDRPGDALHADRPRGRGQRAVRRRLRRRPLQRPRRQHE